MFSSVCNAGHQTRGLKHGRQALSTPPASIHWVLHAMGLAFVPNFKCEMTKTSQICTQINFVMNAPLHYADKPFANNKLYLIYI